MRRARRWARYLLIPGGIVLALLLWGVVVEPRLIDVEQHAVEIPSLPPAWRGKEVALIADLQVGMWLGNTGTIERIVRELLARRPAAVLLAGDFIYHPTDESGEPREARKELEAEDVRETQQLMERVQALLRPLPDAGIPTFAVLGNHDYAMETPESLMLPGVARAVRDGLERIGVQVLENQAVPVILGVAGGAQEPLYIVGIGAHYPHRDRPAEAVAQVPDGAARIVFMHNPDSFAGIPAGAAPLALAGHTHGGQIRLPFAPEWSWLMFFRSEAVHADGWIDGYGNPGNRLYVNRGIGFSYVPVRFNCRPEVNYFMLDARPRLPHHQHSALPRLPVHVAHGASHLSEAQLADHGLTLRSALAAPGSIMDG